MAAGNTTYEDPIPQPGGEETTTPLTLEGVLDKIADAIITSPHTNISSDLVNRNQKTIRNGIISIGRQNSEKLVLFQKDIKANAEDLQSTSGGETLSSFINTISEFGGVLETTQVTISPLQNGAFSIYLVSGDLDFDITNILSEVSTSEDGTQTILNPLNVSQFINVIEQQTEINPEQANEFLDTTIYELLPAAVLRQEQINELFVNIDDLLPPNPPTDDDYGITSNQRINRNEDGDWIGSEQYYLDNSISATQDRREDATIDEQQSYITRLNENANGDNTSKTIESLRNRLNLYLKDVDEQPIEPQDDRLEYENQSSGYLKFRNLNQGIIIRNTNSEFIEGLNPNSIEYLQTGFTITMWVRFLDKSSQGTLFNFGNPTRQNNPFGFKLETYVVNGNDLPTVGDFVETSEGSYLQGFGSGFGTDTIQEELTWKQMFQNDGYPGLTYDSEPPNQNFFQNTDVERFVRLVVKDGDGVLRGSHIGTNFMDRRNGLPEFGYYDNQGDYDHAYGLMTNTRIPTDFTEWYFICATFNPNIDETESHNNTSTYDSFKNNSDFWRNNVLTNGSSVVNSELGAKCKVEIISRSDLLRARGFKV